MKADVDLIWHRHVVGLSLQGERDYIIVKRERELSDCCTVMYLFGEDGDILVERF